MSGLSTQYGNNENFSLLIRHIPALAFLPPDEIPAAFDELRGHIPLEANEIIQWFEDNCVYGNTATINEWKYSSSSAIIFT